MIRFDYVITDEVGIHARPAGLLAKRAKEFQSDITVEKDGKSASASKLMALMGLGVKHGDRISVTVNGPDEKDAAREIEAFLKANL